MLDVRFERCGANAPTTFPQTIAPRFYDYTTPEWPFIYSKLRGRHTLEPIIEEAAFVAKTI